MGQLRGHVADPAGVAPEGHFDLQRCTASSCGHEGAHGARGGRTTTRRLLLAPVVALPKLWPRPLRSAPGRRSRVYVDISADCSSSLLFLLLLLLPSSILPFPASSSSTAVVGPP